MSWDQCYWALFRVLRCLDMSNPIEREEKLAIQKALHLIRQTKWQPWQKGIDVIITSERS